jgi:hypothetical protein
MFGDGALAFREFTMKERVPLATIHAAILEILRSRRDAVLFGAQAVSRSPSRPSRTRGTSPERRTVKGETSRTSSSQRR